MYVFSIIQKNLKWSDREVSYTYVEFIEMEMYIAFKLVYTLFTVDTVQN